MKNILKSIVHQFYQWKHQYGNRVMVIFILFFIPIAASLALGYEMGYNKIETIPTVIMDHDNSEFSRTISEYIEENDMFHVVQYAQSDQEVRDMIMAGKAMMGVIMPIDLAADMKKGKAPKVLAFYDGSMMPVTSSAKSAMAEIFITLKAGYLQEVYEGKLDTVSSQALKQVQPIEVTYRTLFNPTRSYRNFLLPGMLVALVQVGIVIMGVEQSKKSNKNFWQACKAICIWGLLGTGSIFCCLGMQFLFFGLPYRGSLVAGLLSTFLFATCLIGFGYLVGKIIRDTVFATQTACVIVLPTSILGGYTYPLMSMPQSFQSIGNLIPFTHYGNAIRNLCLKEMSFTQLTPDIMILLGFLVAELLILFGIFCVEKNHETKISSFSEL